ncbi:MAG: organomercurial lyase [Acidimicrobiia bacterium]|nr:organomercurial lyase [Acidimicrobiia bacterium]
MAVSWLTPGQLVAIDAPCLDCAQPIHIEMRDGTVIAAEPEAIVGHVSVPFRRWAEQLPFA